MRRRRVVGALTCAPAAGVLWHTRSAGCRRFLPSQIVCNGGGGAFQTQRLCGEHGARGIESWMCVVAELDVNLAVLGVTTPLVSRGVTLVHLNGTAPGRRTRRPAQIILQAFARWPVWAWRAECRRAARADAWRSRDSKRLAPLRNLKLLATRALRAPQRRQCALKRAALSPVVPRGPRTHLPVASLVI